MKSLHLKVVHLHQEQPNQQLLSPQLMAVTLRHLPTQIQLTQLVRTLKAKELRPTLSHQLQLCSLSLLPHLLILHSHHLMIQLHSQHLVTDDSSSWTATSTITIKARLAQLPPQEQPSLRDSVSSTPQLLVNQLCKKVSFKDLATLDTRQTLHFLWLKI